jgi:hypothetical protein
MPVLFLPPRLVALLTVALFVTSTFSCTRIENLFRNPRERERILANVGTHVITRRDLELRNQQQRLENPQFRNELASSLAQLVEAEMAVQLMARNGFLLENSHLEAEAARIDRETQMPGRLQEIKNALPRREDYLRLYVLPILAKRLLKERVFSLKPELQAEPRKLIEGFQKAVIEAPKKKRIEKFRDLSYREGLTFSAETLPALKALPPSENSAVKQLLRKILSELTVGETTPILENDEHFFLLQLVEKNKQGSLRYQRATIQRLNFERWFLEAAREVPVICLEAPLCGLAFKKAGR